MNYRHFDFPNSQGRDVRLRGGAAASGSTGSYMVMMVLVSLLAMLFAVAVVAALSQARPSETAGISPTDRNAATTTVDDEGDSDESRLHPFVAPTEGSTLGDGPTEPGEGELNDKGPGVPPATLEDPAFAEARAWAGHVGDGLERYLERHGELAGFKPGKTYRLTNYLSTPDGTQRLRTALNLDEAIFTVEPGLDLDEDLLVVALPKSEWIVEVIVQVEARPYTYRLYHDGMEEYLELNARR